MDQLNKLQASVSLVVMAKAPVPGTVKTRLLPALGSRRATEVYQQLLIDTLQILSRVNANRILSCAPGIQHAAFRKYSLRFGWQRARQPTGSLGSRMSKIISQCQQYSDYTILVGSDMANMNEHVIQQCIEKLNIGYDLVLGSTIDGGYGLIAMSRLHAELFRQIPWSTDRVMPATLSCARRLNLKTAVIEGLWDVDTYADYRRWRLMKRIS